MARAASERADEPSLLVKVAGEVYGIPARLVAEVVRRAPLTRVPNSTASLAGLMNFQGAAIPVVSIAELLGRRALATGSSSRIVVCDQGELVGLMVDEVVELSSARTGKLGSAKSLDLAALLARDFGERRPDKPNIAPGEVPAAPVATVKDRLLAFRVGGQRFAFALDAVIEVMALPPVFTTVPRSDAATVGLLESRDGVLPLMSLAALLGLEEREGRRNIVVTRLGGARLGGAGLDGARLGAASVGLVVGKMDGVIGIAKSAIEPVPSILQRGAGDAEIEAIARVGGDEPLISILSPARLFQNQSIVEAVDAIGGGVGTMAKRAAEGSDLQFVVFTLGSERYGLPIGAVEEVSYLPDTVTKLPNAPAFFTGVINHRGQALPIIDLRKRFDAPTIAGGKRQSRIVILTIGAIRAGLVVDGVSDILRIAETAVAAAPHLPGEGGRVFDRVAADAAGDIILVVDPKELLDRAEQDLIGAFVRSGGSVVPT